MRGDRQTNRTVDNDRVHPSAGAKCVTVEGREINDIKKNPQVQRYIAETLVKQFLLTEVFGS